MKKIFLYSALVIISLFLASCGGNDKLLVKETCERFIEVILKGDLETAKTMVTPETLKKWGSAANYFDEILTPEIRADLGSAKSKVSNVVIEGDNARATLTVGIPAEMVGEVTILHLKKHGNVWFINEPGILVKQVLEEETVIVDPIEE